MAVDNLIEVDSSAADLSSLPIPDEWVLEGAPAARCRIVTKSTDGTAKTVIWDCTAGRFNWFYNQDETVYVLEGSFSIKEPSGATRLAKAGDMVLFRAGSQAEWTVPQYVRKVAFLRDPVPSYAQFIWKVFRKLGRLGSNEKPSVFG